MTPEQAVRALGRLRRRLRGLLVTHAVGIVVSVGVGLLLALVLLDWALRLPGLIRVVHLVVLAGLGVWAWVRLVRPCLRFEPGDATLALRGGRALGGRGASLAAGVELARESAGEPLEQALRRRAIAYALGGFDAGALRRLPDPHPARLGLALAAIAVSVVMLGAVWRPGLAKIGLARALTPWTNAAWPKRHPIADATGLAVHPVDRALPVRGVLLTRRGSSSGADVEVKYRTVGGAGGASAWSRAQLTPQNKRVVVGGTDQTGVLFERLIDVGVDGGAGDDLRVQYILETSDDKTRRAEVRLVRPPEVELIRARVTPPEYAGGIAGIAAGESEIDPGGGGDAVIGAVLDGSDVALSLRFNKPMGFDGRPAWLEPLGGDGVSFESRGATATVSFRAGRSVRLPIVLRDEHGIVSRRAVMLAVDVIGDQPPTASVAVPARDEQVLATAVLDVVGEARDDFGLAWARLEALVARVPGGSPGAPVEPDGVWQMLGGVDRPGESTHAQIEHTLDLSVLSLSPGDEVRLSTLGKDGFVLGEQRHEPVRSAVRRLRVIDEAALIAQLRSGFDAVRTAAMRLDERQGGVSAASQETPDTDQRQDAVTRGVRAQRRAVEDLARRVEANRLGDRSIRGLLDDAQAALGEAAQASENAGEQLRANDPERARTQQDRVRDRLGELVAMLDRGKDGWLARRSLARLIEQQQRLGDETQSAGEGTRGKSLNELDEQERTDLQRIADRQREIAERVRETTDELDERAKDLAESDPVQSAAMAQAAKRSRQGRAGDTLEEAADQIGSNQTGAAEQSQDEALDALQEALEELDNAERRRDDALRRMVGTLKATIETLIRRQHEELARLDAGEAVEGLGAALIALHGQTLAARAQTDAMRELRSVGRLLDSAGESQSGAIAVLRSEEPERPAVRTRERQSLRFLEDALSEAERVEREAQQREAQRVREELRKAYREVLELQAALRRDCEPLLGRRLNRRQRAEARALGLQQSVLRDRLGEIETQTEALAELSVFRMAHRRLDAAAAAAGDGLGSGMPTRRVGRAQSEVVDLLAGLVEALGEDEPSSEYQSAQGQSGGGSGGGGQTPAIPPVAELKLLRSMQRQALGWTQSLESAPEAGEIDELGRFQRELADQAAELIERHNQQPGSGEPSGGPIEEMGGGAS